MFNLCLDTVAHRPSRNPCFPLAARFLTRIFHRHTALSGDMARDMPTWPLLFIGNFPITYQYPLELLKSRRRFRSVPFETHLGTPTHFPQSSVFVFKIKYRRWIENWSCDSSFNALTSGGKIFRGQFLSFSYRSKMVDKSCSVATKPYAAVINLDLVQSF